MNRRTLLATAAAVAASFGLATPGHAATELTYSTWVAPNHPINTKIILPWFQKVEKAAGGTVKFRTLAKPVAAPNQHYDAIVKGTVDVTFAVHGYQPERFMPYLIGELPQLGETAVHTSVAMWRMHKQHLEKLGLHKDVQLIGLMTHGPGQMHHAKKAIMKPADLKGEKIRVGGDVPRMIVEHFGGVVISQPASKSYEILSQGIADGIFFPSESIKSFNLTKLVPHTTYVRGGLYSSSFWFAMNKEKWDKLDPKAKAAIAKYGGEYFARHGGAGWDKADREGREEAKKAGNTLKQASPEFVAELSKVTAKIEADYAARLDKLGLNGKAVIKDLRTEVGRVQPSN